MSDSIKNSSWISVIGLPNAGKSTLFNTIMGNKIAIVTPKSQTTRNTIKGIKTIGSCQLVFIDTPGFLTAKKRIDKFMQNALNQALADSDHILFLHDATKDLQSKQENILASFKKNHIPCSLVLNKIDKVEKTSLLNIAKRFSDRFDFKNVFMISALKRKGVDDLVKYLVSDSKNPGWHFSSDRVTTAPNSFLIEEVIREKILFNTQEEIPYNVYLETEMFEETKHLIKSHVTIFVPTLGRKKIILGSQGELIKKISTQARLELENIFQKKIFLKTFIKVRDWEKSLTDNKFINY